jgi:hypothetical protein
MAEKPYDPDFKHLTPSGWQRLPRAVRDAFMNSPHTPSKYRVWLYCLQVWDKDSRHGLNRDEPEPIRQRDVVAGLGMADDQVNRLVYDMQDDGMIHVGVGGRIFPMEQPVLKAPATESLSETERRLFAEYDPHGYAEWLPAWEAIETKRAELRRVLRNKVKEAKKAGPKAAAAGIPEMVPSGTTPEIGGTTPKTGGTVQEKPAYIRKRERDKSNTASSSVFTALSKYGKPDDDAVKTLLEKCKANAPDVTPDEVARIVHMKGLSSQKPSVRNSIGFLLEVVPKMFPKILTELREVEKAPPDMSVYVDGKKLALGPTLDEAIDSAIGFAEDDIWHGTAQQTEGILDVEQYTKDDPEAVARVRARRGNTKTRGAS